MRQEFPPTPPRRRLTLAVLAAVVAACSHLPPRESDLPALRLSPASLDRSLALQQRVTVFAPGSQPSSVEVLLEADAQALRLAAFGMGLTLARIEWDGRDLTSELAPGWPPELTADRVLLDLQLALWPLAALRAALPAGWSLIDEAGSRRLRQHGEDVTVVSFPDALHVEIDHRRRGYRVSIESRALLP
jgi:hypothetical protein